MEESWASLLTPEFLGAGALLSLCIAAIMKGWLVPITTVKRERENHDKQIALMERLLERSDGEREQWRQAYVKSEEARDVQQAQTGAVVETLKTTEAVLRAITPPGEGAT